MNIIILSDYAFINGGATKVAIDNAIGLAKQGYQTIYFASVAPIEPELMKSGVKVICLQQHDLLNDPIQYRAALQGLWNVFAAKQMADLLSQYSPKNTIIHVHGWTKALSSSPIRVALRHGFKVVLTMHDYFIACPNGGFFDYPTNTLCQRRALSFSCVSRNCDVRNYQQKLWRVIRQLIQKNIGRIPSEISGIIAISNFSLEILRQYIPSNSIIKIIPNPVQATRVEAVDVSLNKEMVYIGRLSKEKGVELFAEAIQKLNCSGVIVGDGPLANMLRKNYPSVHYTGWLPHKEVINILKKARALIFPSLWYEVQPLVVLEAMAYGVPPIIPDTSGARDFVVDGITGLVFKRGDVIDLEKKIKIVLDNDDLAKKIGNSAYNQFWKNPLTLELYIDTVKNIYQEILRK